MEDKRVEKLKKWWDRDKVPVIIGRTNADLDDINAAVQLIIEDYGTIMSGDELAILNRDTVPKKLTSIEEGDLYKPMTKEATMQRKTAESILTIRKKVTALENDVKALVIINRKHGNAFMKKEAGKGLSKLMLALGLLGTGGFLGAKSGVEALQPNSYSPLRGITNKMGLTDATFGEYFAPTKVKLYANLMKKFKAGEIGSEDLVTGYQNIEDQAEDELAQINFLESEKRKFAKEDAATIAEASAKEQALAHHNERQRQNMDKKIDSLSFNK